MMEKDNKKARFTSNYCCGATPRKKCLRIMKKCEPFESPFMKASQFYGSKVNYDISQYREPSALNKGREGQNSLLVDAMLGEFEDIQQYKLEHFPHVDAAPDEYDAHLTSSTPHVTKDNGDGNRSAKSIIAPKSGNSVNFSTSFSDSLLLKVDLNTSTSNKSNSKNSQTSCNAVESVELLTEAIPEVLLDQSAGGINSVTGKETHLSGISKEVPLTCESAAGSSQSSLFSSGRSTLFTPAQGDTQFSIEEKMKNRMLQNAGKSAQELRIQNMATRTGAATEDSLFNETGSQLNLGPFFGLPAKVKELLHAVRGIQQLYEWQVECLSLPAVVEHRNLIYTLPTSGGKTLVAEILILRELLCRQRDAILILPFVSIVQEKVRSLCQFSAELGFVIEEYAAGKGQLPPRKRRRKRCLYVATIEKCHSLINSLLDAGRISTVGLVVVDELHMLGEGGSRGATLETLLAKLMFASGSSQIIGMSATLSNLNDLQSFLKADVYHNEFRPVELKEYVKVEDNIYSVNTTALCPDDVLKHDRFVKYPYSSKMKAADPDHLLGLVSEVVPHSSCLIFCPTKKNCENVATMLCDLMPKRRRQMSNQ